MEPGFDNRLKQVVLPADIKTGKLRGGWMCIAKIHIPSYNACTDVEVWLKQVISLGIFGICVAEINWFARFCPSTVGPPGR